VLPGRSCQDGEGVKRYASSQEPGNTTSANAGRYPNLGVDDCWLAIHRSLVIAYSTSTSPCSVPGTGSAQASSTCSPAVRCARRDPISPGE